MRIKKCMAGFLAFALTVGCVPSFTLGAKAAETTNTNDLKVIYEYAETEGSYVDYFEQYAGKGTEIPFDGVEYGFYWESDKNVEATASETDDYLFGGFYKLVFDATGEVIESLEKVATKSELTADDALCVKWIPASMLSVKTQNHEDVSSSSNTASTAKIRVVSGIDSLKYSQVGMDLLVVDKNKTNSMVSYEKNDVYSSMLANSNTVKPSDLFGSAANYFAVFSFNNIPSSGFGTAIYTRPWVKTADGTKVYGLPRYSRIEDGYTENKYINVPVNFKPASSEQAAAGVLELTYDATKFKFHSFDAGQVFEEMEYNDNNGTVKIVGNVQDIQNNKQLNNLFANIRFERVNGATINLSKEIFEVKNLDFCDKDEQALGSTFSIWNVRY